MWPFIVGLVVGVIITLRIYRIDPINYYER